MLDAVELAGQGAAEVVERVAEGDQQTAGALLALSLAALAGLGMVLSDPAPGSTFESFLGFTAAACGLATAFSLLWFWTGSRNGH